MLSKFQEQAKKVNFLNIYKARKTVYQSLKKTHLIHYSSLSELIGAEVYVKHENHNPTGSFKIRGAVNFMANVSDEIRDKGIIVATRGNHGLATAWAARNENVFCNVAVPLNNNPEINNAITGLGAELMQHGKDFYETQAYCEEIADELGYYYIEQGNEPDILNGLGTMGLEIFEDLPDVDIIIIPVGGGGGCASLIKVSQAINPEVQIIGVIAEKAPSLKLSLEKGEPVTTDSSDTFADGLASRSIFQIPYIIIKDAISDVVMVTEKEIIQGVLLSLTHTHNLAEGAGAAGIACALKIKEQLAGKKVVVVMTGSNLDRKHLAWALNE
ncbi:MAG TPA: pyridoxal-phosphate dependent enzyme [Spirochaetota bacterium]|nr:pyridoxal-phosphate dependent enzyme [Spirochaetota bacterium]HPI87800.1 pyridoxal-phosphate dependent enzyme [Spirochaetota bacterium]HPR47024.1 pyridoxal-phosphate dependent enzyme [Spirochaetota bacterium]